MVRDAAALEKRGIPTVTLVHDKFVPAARAQAKVLGLPSLQIASVPQPMPWETEEDERRKGSAVIETVVAMLTKPRPPAVEA
ncbi:MAG: hypothetical protein HYX92_05680 [Chloroflexi bacterium]|nr:hypothetical protein [Chloroflexota bacterium]